MVNFAYADLFRKDSIHKNLHIYTNSISLDNDDIYQESFTLTESLCSNEQLTFGSCEASSVQFTVANNYTSLIGEWITIDLILDNNNSKTMRIGTYKVTEDVLSADKSKREVTAYDVLSEINARDYKSWYNSLTFPMTLKAFRNSFFSYSGVVQETISLANDNMTVEKTIDAETISGNDILSRICEINGAFGHITRDNKFRYVIVGEIIDGLYPKDDLYPANNLYPVESNIADNVTKSRYISSTYQDYVVQNITKLQIRQEENDIGTVVGTDGNNYVVEDNFLVYGKNSTDLRIIAQNLLNVIKYVSYKPCTVKCLGNPCIECGDCIRIYTTNEVISSVVFQRKLSGIQLLTDEYESNGNEKYTEEINGFHSSITQLKGKTNVLKRDVEHLESTVYDAETGQSKIEQTAQAITSEVTRAKQAEGSLSSSIKQTADAITSEVTRAKQAEGTLSSSIKQTSDSISAEVTRATNAEGTLSGRIDVTDRNVSAKVSSSGGSSSSFGWSLTDSGFTLQSSGSTVFSCNSGGVSITGNVNVTNTISADKISGGTLNIGNIELSGTINGQNIGDLTASKITSGSFDTDRIPSLNASKIGSGTIDNKRLNCSSIVSDGISADIINGVYATANTFSANRIKTTYIQTDYAGRAWTLSPTVVNGYLVFGTKYS